MRIQPGTRIHRYEIQSLLGVGGMGEVYRALDIDLNRPVALKFLSAEFASQPSRINRFIQEAKAASALNHPNIITVYEFGRMSDEENAPLFFATEFIDGVTLREHMSKGIKLGEILDIAMQVSSALVAAHTAGIVHRDIKPENIMYRHDGYIKVLDFGLAKPTGRQLSATDSDAETLALVNTEPGAVMGTVSYMSPEQARGLELDGRTDIWSLGVVLYEMIAGRVPFTGPTSSHVIVSLLEDEPEPLTTYVPKLPEAFQWIIEEALRKDREERTQTAKQLLGKLRRLKQMMETGAGLDYSGGHRFSIGSGRAKHASKGMRSTAEEAGRETKAAAHEGERAVTTSSAEYIVTQIKRHKTGALLGLTLALVALLGIAGLIYKLAFNGRGGETRRQMKITSLTHSGKATNGVISPDGKYVAYIFNDGNKQSLLLRQTATSSSKEILAPSDGYFLGATFTPDGNYLYYVKGSKGENVRSLYQISVLGGDSRLRLNDVDSPVTFSPDGKRMAFIRGYFKERKKTLFVANEDGSGEEALTTRQAPFTAMDNPSWSPDGSSIAFIVAGTDSEGYFVNVDQVRVADKAEGKISSDRWRSISAVTWLPDGSGLLIVARDRASVAGSPQQIWHIMMTGKEARKVTNDLHYYTNVSVAADSLTFVASYREQKSGVWISLGADTESSRQISTNIFSGLEGVTWTPDGRIVYTSVERDNYDIGVMNADGSSPKQLTFDPAADLHPSVSPDGRYIVFESTRGVRWGIWRMNADGTNPVELVRNIGEFSNPQCSRDSRWVIYAANSADGRQVLWKVSIDGGGPVQITDEHMYGHSISPDGRLVAYYYRGPESGAKLQIKVVSVEEGGSSPVKTLDAIGDGERMRWSPDGTALDYIYTHEGVSNLWRRSLEGGQPKALTGWKADRIFWFEWSPDGKQLACSRGMLTTDLILIQDMDF